MTHEETAPIRDLDHLLDDLAAGRCCRADADPDWRPLIERLDHLDGELGPPPCLRRQLWTELTATAPSTVPSPSIAAAIADRGSVPPPVDLSLLGGILLRSRWLSLAASLLLLAGLGGAWVAVQQAGQVALPTERSAPERVVANLPPSLAKSLAGTAAADAAPETDSALLPAEATKPRVAAETATGARSAAPPSAVARQIPGLGPWGELLTVGATQGGRALIEFQLSMAGDFEEASRLILQRLGLDEESPTLIPGWPRSA